MSYNYNQCTLMGRLTRDPEFKQITENFCKLSFTIAINRRYRKESGIQETDFIPVSLIGNMARIGQHILGKGTAILLWGSIQIRNYEKDNERKWITEIVADNFQALDKRKQHTQTESNAAVADPKGEEAAEAVFTKS